ncbi:MAG: hypothetical protein AMXMBFR12_05740 [Candidatus Babeliales bacterium]
MKFLLLLTMILIFLSHAMERDPRVYPQMVQMGMDGSYIGMSTPQIQPDGKKIYFAKGLVNGVEKIVMVRYHADDTLDISFGQNGVACEVVKSNVFITNVANNHASGQKPIGALIKATQEYRVQENDSCMICLQESKTITFSNIYLTSCCKKLMCHPCYVELLGKTAKLRCPNCRNEDNFQLVQ